MHGDQVGSPTPRKVAARYPGADLLVYGHSHRPTLSRIGDAVVVNPGSAAERAGLRDGDVLVRVGGEPVNTFEELRNAIRARQPGDVVRLVYLRDGRDPGP